MFIKYKALLSLALVATMFTACKKEDPKPEPEPEPNNPGTSYTIPTTYNFSNADFSTSTKRLAMLGEITTYIRSTHTTTQSTQPTLNAQKLKDMYSNTNNAFSDASLNSSGIQLKEKTGNAWGFQSALETNFDDAAAASVLAAANPTTSTASSGNKGKIISPSRAILVDANGYEYKEFAEKGLMGAVFYYQATTLLNTISTFDNSTEVNGATAQERAWDEAFGYFGVPVDFPTNLTGLKNWGNYCNSVNGAIGSNATIMNAFLKGRAAISNNDVAARDAARDVVVATWEKVVAAKCINYLKGAKTNFADAGTLHHSVSEAYGFVTSFRYNTTKKLSDSDINNLLNELGTNFYNITQANLDNAINILATKFGLDASKL